MDRTVVRTLLLCDLVDSTQLTVALGDRRSADLFARVDRFARDLLRDTGGLEIDKTDGFLMLFERPADAIKFAVGLHDALASLSTEEDVQFAMRVGIHLGEIVLRENSAEDVARGAKPIEVDGLSKPLAARVMSNATGGQTLLTSAAYTLAKRAAVDDEALSELHWEPRETFLPKGLNEPIELFEVSAVPLEAFVPTPIPPSRPAIRLAWRPVVAGVLTLVAASAVAVGFLGGPAPSIQYFGAIGWTSNGLAGEGPPLASLPPWGAWEVTMHGDLAVQIRPVNGSGGLSRPLQFQHEELPHGPMVNRWDEEDPDDPNWSFAAHFFDRPPSWIEQTFNDDGRLDGVEVRDTYGALRQELSLEFTDDGLQFHAQNAVGQPITQVNEFSHLTRHRALEFDDAGRVALTRELHAFNNHSQSVDGSHGSRVERDESGRVVAEHTLDADDNPIRVGDRLTLNREYGDPAHPDLPTRVWGTGLSDLAADAYPGCPEVHRRATDDGYVLSCHDDRGAPIRFHQIDCHALAHRWIDDSYLATCLDVTGEPAMTAMGWTTVRDQLDTRGQATERRLGDIDGSHAPTLFFEHRVTIEYDDRGAVRSTLVFDDDGATVREGELCRRVTRDALGREVELALIDADGKPRVGAMGWAIRKTNYGEGGQRMQIAWFDPAGKPVQHIDSAHQIRYHYTADGRLAGQDYIGIDGRPHPLNGIASVRATIEGTVNSISFFGPGLVPTWMTGGYGQQWEDHPEIEWVLETAGYHTRRVEALEESHRYRVSLLDEEGQLVTGLHGWAMQEYDKENAEIVEVRLYDEDRQPTETVFGWSRIHTDRDGAGRVLSVKQWDHDGVPTADALTGCVSHEIEWSHADFVKRRVCQGISGRPVIHQKMGSPIRTYAYTEAGNLRSRFFHDADGELAPNAFGVAEERMAYDARNNEIERAFFDADGQPVLHDRTGYAKWTDTFDQHGRLVETTLWGTDGKPMIAPLRDYATMKIERNARGLPTSQKFYDEQGRPAPPGYPAEYRHEWDDNGHQTRATYVNADGALTLHHGVAEQRSVYDDRGRLVRTEYRGLDGELVSPRGYGIKTVEYDPANQIFALNFALEEDRPAARPEGGYARWEVERNGQGLPIVERWLTGELEPTAGPWGCEVLARSYNERTGEVLEVTCDGRSIPPDQNPTPFDALR